MVSRRLTPLLIAIGIIVASVAVGGYIVSGIGDTHVPSHSFSIEKGDSYTRLPERLGISVSPTLYRLWCRWQCRTSLQVGTYTVATGSTLSDVVHHVLTSEPSTEERTITIIPGWNLADTDVYLSSLGLIETGSLIHLSPERWQRLQKTYPFLADAKSVEGFLLPDTYDIRTGAKLDDILDTVLQAFNKEIIQKYNLAPSDLITTLTLASIVEKEEKNPVNKPTVAGIFKNRLAKRMPLGADITVCEYPIITHTDCTPTVVAERISHDTPYNTRHRIGLPPTPIASVFSVAPC